MSTILAHKQLNDSSFQELNIYWDNQRELLLPVLNGNFVNKTSDNPCFPYWEGNYGSYTHSHSGYISNGANALSLTSSNDNAYQNLGVLSYIPYCFRFKIAASGAYSFRILIAVKEIDGTLITPTSAFDSASNSWHYESGKDVVYRTLTSQNGWLYFDDVIRFKKDSSNHHANSIQLKFDFTGTTGEIRVNDVLMYPVKDESTYYGPSVKSAT